MIYRMVIYLRGQNLQSTVPDNSPLRNQEGSLVAGSGAGSLRERASVPTRELREEASFLKERNHAPMGWYLSGYWLEEQRHSRNI